MTTHHTAQGLASLGRHGDTMLVHMSPHEVAGLNFLAKKQGTKLTINPDTGLPEAFSLSGLFGSILPMFAGAMFPGAGFAMQPLLAGALTGGVLAKVQGKDPLMGGLMGGLGGISGSNLAQGLTGAAGGIQGAVPSAGGYVPGTVEGANTALNIPGASMMNNPAVTNAQNLIAQSGAGAGSAASGASAFNPTDTLSKITKGTGNLITGKPGAWEGFKNAFVDPKTGTGALTDFQAATKIGMPIGGAVLGGLEPSDLYGEPLTGSDKDKYDPYATLNLSGDTGLRLYKQGGEINSYALGGTVSNPSVGGGLADLYNRPEGQTLENISSDAYGLGRLSQLGSEQARYQAQTLGYAMGGPVSFADGGDTNPITGEIAPVEDSMGIAALAPTASTQSMPSQSVQNAAASLSGAADASTTGGSIIEQVTTKLQQDPNYQPQNPIEAAIVKQIKGTDENQQGQQGLASLGPVAPSQPMAPTYTASQPMTPTYYAGMNAPKGYAEGGETSLNLDKLPSLNVNTGESQAYIDPNAELQSQQYIPGDMSLYFTNMLRKADGKEPIRANPESSGMQLYAQNMLNTAAGKDRIQPITRPSGMQEYFKIIQNLGQPKSNMATGGYLDGQGDGMSDSIPATIEGKQPARLADGEFVVPADVVSHLGNGSSKAGSKRLYAMLDKVRQARTGHTKQGKQIKAEKYLPA